MKNILRLCMYIFICLLCLSLNCNREIKPNSVLPPETQEGKNTMGCKINGKIWEARSDNSRIIYNTGKFNYSFSLGYNRTIVGLDFEGNGYLENSKYSKYSYVRISLVDSLDDVFNKSYNLQPDITKYPRLNMSYSYSDDSLKNVVTSYATSGKLFFTKIDTLERIVSGRFEFITRNNHVITEGRFDLKLPKNETKIK